LSLIKGTEVPRGVQIALEFFAENMGPSEFPGGQVSSLSFQILLDAGQRFGLVDTDERRLPVLAPGERKSILEYTYTFQTEGVAEVVVEIETDDGVPVRYRKIKEGKILPEWKRSLIVVSREQLQMVDLLQQLLSKKENA
jgi:hypothetical protein